MTTTSPPIVLSIAGSDSGGGAGIQADIKAISATGGYAATVITAITAQNTLGVHDVFPIPAKHVAAQLDAVFSDLDVQAVKIGMLADTNIIQVVADKLRQYQPKHVVLDPVMVATSGDLLLRESAVQSLKTQLFPLATLITPNLPEAMALIGDRFTLCPASHTDIEPVIGALKTVSDKAFLLKGGHLADQEDCIDWLIQTTGMTSFTSPRFATQNTHGTGCSLSSAIASYLARGVGLEEAVEQAKAYLSQAIFHADTLKIGTGHGPVHHFYGLAE